MTIPAGIVKMYFRLSGRQKKFDNEREFEVHLEECRIMNMKDYEMPARWDFGKPRKSKEFCGNPCYIINPGKDVAIVYLHGGSGIHQMLSFHYKFLKKLLRLADVTIYLPIYPLSPDNTYKECYEMLDAVYAEVVEFYGRITVMGDSMGGNIALGLSEHVERKPDTTVLISPWLDMSMDDSRYPEYYLREPRLSMNELKRCGDCWSVGTDKKDPLVSPLYGDLSGLDITVLVGTEEVLLLDSQRLRDRAMAEGIDIHYYEYEGMTHDFPLQPIKEAEDAMQKILEHIARSPAGEDGDECDGKCDPSDADSAEELVDPEVGADEVSDEEQKRR